MKIVITGGTGFLGNFLVDKLRKKHEVFILSRREKENTIQTDYSYESLLEVLKNKDAIIHLAASRSGEFNFTKFFNDIELTENLYKAANENNIKNIVYASSISVYSDIDKLPWNESQYVDPVTMYGISKLTNEMLGNIYNRKFNMNIKNLRMAHLFGPDERNNYMINYFFRLAYNNKDIFMDTSSVSKREFLYVKDAGKAFVLALEKKDLKGTFNIGSQITLNNLEVAENIKNVFNSDNNIIIKNPEKEDNSKPSYMNSDKAKKELDFACDYNFEEALTEIYKKLEEMKDVPLRY